jgi:hypothetical protein
VIENLPNHLIFEFKNASHSFGEISPIKKKLPYSAFFLENFLSFFEQKIWNVLKKENVFL